MNREPLAGATAEQVWDALAHQVRPAEPQSLRVAEALGRVLAHDVRAAIEHPPFDRAVMDGYAVRAADFSGGRARLKCIGLVRAGTAQTYNVESGTCAQINTGAPLPLGADAVVIVEKSRDTGDGFVELEDQPRADQHVERRAALVRRDDLLVRAGVRIEPGTAAAIVAGGVRTVSVFPPPTVGIVSTGDEIVSSDNRLKAGQIYDSNAVSLPQIVRRLGGEPGPVERSPDQPASLRAALELGLQNDMLCVIGGMSKGTHDLAPPVLELLGVQWLVTSLSLKPGKPMRIGRGPAGCWVLGLPGNPVSCAVCFLLFGKAILEGLQGLGSRRPPHATATLEADMPATQSRPMYHPGEWMLNDHGDILVTPLLWRGSGDPFGLATANALIRRPAQASPAARGERVTIVPIGDPR